MTSKIRVTLCQMSVGADKAANIAKAVSMIQDAAKRGSEFAVLPECFNCPYGTKYFGDYAEALKPGNSTFDAMSSVSRESKIWVVAGSIPEKGPTGQLFNSCMIFSPDGTLRHVHRKVHLFRLNTDKVKFDEGETLTPGSTAIAVPMEDPQVKFGVAICFDIRYPMMAYEYTKQGTSFLIYPGAFNMVTGPLHWELSARARAVDNQQFVVLCSPARDETAEYVAWGHSLVVDPVGKVLGQLEAEEGYLDAVLDLSQIAPTRDSIPILKGIRSDLYDFTWKQVTE